MEVPAAMLQTFGMVTFPPPLSATKLVSAVPAVVWVWVNSYWVVLLAPPISTVTTCGSAPLPQFAVNVIDAESLVWAYLKMALLTSPTGIHASSRSQPLLSCARVVLVSHRKRHGKKVLKIISKKGIELKV